MILLTYTKDVVYQITSSKNCIVNFQMIGGGGGHGGADSYSGSPGYPGLITSGNIALSEGETIYCSIGGGGYSGASGQRSSGGGAGGFAINGYSGGAGGNAGPSGYSGGGGGGGGASLIWKNGATAYNNISNILAVSSGGPGGGGGGRYGAGYGNASVNALVAPRGYYSIALSNNQYTSFLNTYGVWDGNGDYTYEVYFPPVGQGLFTFQLSADNYGAIYVNDYLVVQTQGGEAAYQSVWTGAYATVPGWKTVRIHAQNWGGPASVAAAIKTEYGNIIWTTRESYNSLSYTSLGRGGKGQDHRGDGGGAGGGGGGYSGGTGGTAPSGDEGGMSGNYGPKFLSSNPSLVTAADNTLLADAGGSGLGLGGPSNYIDGAGGGIAFDSTQLDIKYQSSNAMINIKEVYVRSGSTWNKVPEVYVKDSNTWKRVYGDNIPNVASTTVAYNNISGMMTPYPPPPDSPLRAEDVESGGYTAEPAGAPAAGDGCKIICQKLAEMGFFDSAMNKADQEFGVMLRDQDPDAFNGYLRWAQPVVDLLEGKGSVRFRKIVLFWVQDEQRRQQIQSNIVACYLDVIARPWAEEMAYRMKAEGYSKSNPAGRFIMNIGLPMCRSIGRFNKHRESPMWLKTALIWGITTVLLVAVNAISMIDKVFSKIRKIFDRS
jgi:hypothetical protein